MSEPGLIECSVCGTTNRVQLDKQRPDRTPVCGKCKSPLPVSNGPISVTDATFADTVERSPFPVLLDMWAPWCGPCRMIAPVVEELAAEFAGRLRVAKVNVDENPATSARFAIQSIPALLILKGGREIDRIVGAQPKAEILRRLKQVIA